MSWNNTTFSAQLEKLNFILRETKLLSRRDKSPHLPQSYKHLYKCPHFSFRFPYILAVSYTTLKDLTTFHKPFNKKALIIVTLTTLLSEANKDKGVLLPTQ